MIISESEDLGEKIISEGFVIPVYLIKGVWPDGAIVCGSHENLERKWFPLIVSEQLQRETRWEIRPKLR